MPHLVVEAGLDDRIGIESAGTGGWHVGHPPDPRTRAEAERRGIAMTSTARQFQAVDFTRLDLILAMDHQNLADLTSLARDDAERAKVRLLRSYDPAPDVGHDLAVPDPYYGGPEGFRQVFDMVQVACTGLLVALAAQLPARP